MAVLEREVADFLAAHEAELAPRWRAQQEAEWRAATTGRPEAWAEAAEARLAVQRLYDDPTAAHAVTRWLASPELRDPILRRCLELLHRAFTAERVPDDLRAEIATQAAELERQMATFRPEVDGERLSYQELRERWRTTSDLAQRRRYWMASKSIGPILAEPLRRLAALRNRAAREVGFADYYQLALWEQELAPTTLAAWREAFAQRSQAIADRVGALLRDAAAQRFGAPIDRLRPWHFDDPFAQEAPDGLGGADELRFAIDDPVAVAEAFFRRLELPVDEVLARSDLYEREGKDHHAFCINIDRAGDVRILCNLRGTQSSLGTLLHELGHAVYDVHLPPTLPFLLRAPAHIAATEAVALLFGRLAYDPEWLAQATGVHLDAADARAMRRRAAVQLVVACRWMLVMMAFEQAFYAAPHRPDAGRLWWRLVARYQGIEPPPDRLDSSDWATKTHLIGAPVYYHNYLLGECAASQIARALGRRVGAPWGVPTPAWGRALEAHLFASGATTRWEMWLQQVCDEPLGVEAWCDDAERGLGG